MNKKQALESLKTDTEIALSNNKIPFGWVGILSNYASCANAIINYSSHKNKGSITTVREGSPQDISISLDSNILEVKIDD